MARIVVAWELGGGLGHLVPLAPIVRELSRRGDRFFAVVRELAHVDLILPDSGSLCFQAPIKTTKPANRIDPVRTFAHIMHNAGFSDPGELAAMAGAWRNLYEFIRPDLILFDYSPTAILASRSIQTKRVVIGTGFCCPPNASPLPDFRAWLPAQPESLERDENRVLANANHLLESWRLEPLENLAQLHGQVDAAIRATLRELDPYGDRSDTEYYGVWSNIGGRPPVWPDVAGRKVFAYLRHFSALGDLLRALNCSRQPAVVYLDPPDAELRARFEGPTLRFELQPLDLNAVAATCDLAILHGGHGATASMLLAGKPVLAIPLHLEQALNAAAVVRLGAGLSAEQDRPQEIITQLAALLQSDAFGAAAQRFAARYAGFNPGRQIEQVVRRIESLL